jgi:hypothetical protein
MELSDILDLGQRMGMILGLAFYVAIVIWTYKDARKRTEDPIMVATFTAIAMLPLFGVFIYMLVRPSEYLADVRERELEIRALERQLGRQERCPYCKSHIEGDYLSCPVCTTKLRQSCTGCEKPLDPRWVMCPFCETEVPGARGGRGPSSGGQRGQAPAVTPRSGRSESPAREPRSTSDRSDRESRSRDRDRPSSGGRDAKPSSKSASKSTSKSASAPKVTTKPASDEPAEKKSGDIQTEPFGAGDTTRI